MLTCLYDGHPESKDRLHIPVLLQPIIGFLVFSDGENCLMQLYVRILPTVRCEVLFVFCRLMGILLKRQALAWNCYVARQCTPHTAWQTQALLHEQFHWDIFKHSPYSPELAPSYFFLFPKMKEHLVGKCFTNDEDLKDAGWIIRRSHGMKRVYTNWCQGTISTLMSKATMWKSRQRYVPKLVYSVSALLLLKNILVWRNVLYFMDNPQNYHLYIHMHSTTYGGHTSN